MNWIVKTGSISQTGNILQIDNISSKSISLMLLFISTIGCKKECDNETMVYITYSYLTDSVLGINTP